ncbi:hypothetical protein Slala03_02680 [Streptomyces lavendulae subsp. lavendulae]|uniref:hypothetical protein n=1 Tax=Streptomyces lavendulae TaxID=1914 RepID=UPI0024A5DD5C|nr:hypothetical protein [Streptomyces lavendulae]GLV80579.1 hypothetical protein Slala03_02680 [Streptomyces lavendulae subsp. lavendulae]GLX39330.1 hypothetical protein Sros01_54030 [Streptomyces roseochromogenus]
MLRRLVAGLGALALVAEAAVLVLVHLVLGRTTANQSMSIAGSDPQLMSRLTYGLGAAIGAFLLLGAVLLALTALRDRAPGRFARVVLVAVALTHVLLGAIAAGLVTWGAFAVTMVILCLLVLTLTLYAGGRDEPADARGLRPTSP